MASLTTNHTVNLGQSENIHRHCCLPPRIEGGQSRGLGAKGTFRNKVSPPATSRKCSVAAGDKIGEWNWSPKQECVTSRPLRRTQFHTAADHVLTDAKAGEDTPERPMLLLTGAYQTQQATHGQDLLGKTFSINTLKNALKNRTNTFFFDWIQIITAR